MRPEVFWVDREEHGDNDLDDAQRIDVPSGERRHVTLDLPKEVVAAPIPSLSSATYQRPNLLLHRPQRELNRTPPCRFGPSDTSSDPTLVIWSKVGAM